MKKMGIIGGLAMMLPHLIGKTTLHGSMPISESKPKLRKNKPSGGYWRTSHPSERFGERIKIVTFANKYGGLKRMKIKNALKKGLTF